MITCRLAGSKVQINVFGQPQAIWDEAEGMKMMSAVKNSLGNFPGDSGAYIQNHGTYGW